MAAQPFALGTQKCCAPQKPRPARRAHEGGFDAAFGGARRDEESRGPRSGCIRSATPGPVEPAQPAARAVEPLQRPHREGREPSAFSRFRTGPNWTCGNTSTWSHPRGSAVFRARAGSAGAQRDAAAAGTRSAAPHRRETPDGDVPDALAGVHLLHRGRAQRRRYGPQDYRGTAGGPPLGAGEPRHRLRPGRVDGD